jgi:hypothetical protein
MTLVGVANPLGGREVLSKFYMPRQVHRPALEQLSCHVARRAAVEVSATMSGHIASGPPRLQRAANRYHARQDPSQVPVLAAYLRGYIARKPGCVRARAWGPDGDQTSHLFHPQNNNLGEPHPQHRFLVNLPACLVHLGRAGFALWVRWRMTRSFISAFPPPHACRRSYTMLSAAPSTRR